MRAPAVSLLAISALVTACPATNHLSLAPHGEGAAARITEQHDFNDGQVFIWWVDGRKVRERNLVRRVDLEIDVTPGKHVFECSYSSAEMHSTRNAALPLLAESGRVYIVKARGVKEGFWTELGKAFQSMVWPAKTGWVAWIEDGRG